MLSSIHAASSAISLRRAGNREGDYFSRGFAERIKQQSQAGADAFYSRGFAALGTRHSAKLHRSRDTARRSRVYGGTQ